MRIPITILVMGLTFFNLSYVIRVGLQGGYSPGAPGQGRATLTKRIFNHVLLKKSPPPKQQQQLRLFSNHIEQKIQQ